MLHSSPKRRRHEALPPHATMLAEASIPQNPWNRIIAAHALCMPLIISSQERRESPAIRKHDSSDD